MSDRTTNMAASVHQRLLNLARASNRPFNELLQYYGMERFLYRLSMTPHIGKFTLKGALMLGVWKAPLSRPTKDIDLLGRLDNSVDLLASVVRDACAQTVESDGLIFDADSVSAGRIAEDAECEGCSGKPPGEPREGARDHSDRCRVRRRRDASSVAD